MVREVAEETGFQISIDRLLGIDSRTISAAESWSGADHQNVGIYYRVRIVGGDLRPEPDGSTVDARWFGLPELSGLRRSALVEVGLRLDRDEPATGHVPPVASGGLLRH